MVRGLGGGVRGGLDGGLEYGFAEMRGLRIEMEDAMTVRLLIWG